MIRVEVTSEAELTHMTMAFSILPSLRDLDYEIHLDGRRRSWRLAGLRGGSSRTNTIHWADPPGAGGNAAGGGGGTTNTTVKFIGGTCNTCGNPVPGGGHTDECQGLVPGSEYEIGEGS